MIEGHGLRSSRDAVQALHDAADLILACVLELRSQTRIKAAPPRSAAGRRCRARIGSVRHGEGHDSECCGLARCKLGGYLLSSMQFPAPIAAHLLFFQGWREADKGRACQRGTDWAQASRVVGLDTALLNSSQSMEPSWFASTCTGEMIGSAP